MALKGDYTKDNGLTSVLNGRYVMTSLSDNGLVNGFPIYRNEDNNKYVMWYCREWMCHLDGWVRILEIGGFRENK